MIDSLLYAKLPPHLQRSLNLAYLENSTYDQIVAYIEGELELSGLENDGELSIHTMTAAPPNGNQQNSEQTKMECHCRGNLLGQRFCVIWLWKILASG